MAEFSDPMGAQLLSEEDTQTQFNNLVVDKNTGRVYIGGVNKLYQLSPKLEVMVSETFLLVVYLLQPLI